MREYKFRGKYQGNWVYGNLILGAKRYKNAVVNKDDPEKYIRAIWRAGYATDPKYPDKILRIAKSCNFI